MTQLVIMYNLKDGVTKDDFHEWVRTVDQPSMRGLGSVDSFRTFETKSLLMGEGSPSVQYVEIFDLNDFGAFTGTDMPGDVVQGIMGDFMGFADAPQFIVAEEV
ncbi:MAG: REDY-like protein HapK [Hellea sp.]|nr:REDY-like protein HapK [Hellea sp.]